MIIGKFGTAKSGDATVHSASVTWEDNDFPDQELIFEVRADEPECLPGIDQPSADAFLAACFPLAAVHGEARLRIDGQPCPMLVEGLYTAHAWWTSWGACHSRLRLSSLLAGATALCRPVHGGRLRSFPEGSTGFIR